MMECFVIIVNGFQLLTITKRSILNVAASLDPPLTKIYSKLTMMNRGESRTAATSKMGCFVITVNGWKLPAVNYYNEAAHLGCFSSPRSI